MKRICNPILSYIERDFGFLFDKGFRIRDANVSFWSTRSWEVTFESPKYIIIVYCDQHGVVLVLAPFGEIVEYDLRIEAILYYLSKGKNFVGRFEGDFYKDKRGQIERLAGLLKENIDQILPCFEINQFKEHKDELLKAAMEYNRRYMSKYVAGF
jgi:hypothetical protein